MKRIALPLIVLVTLSGTGMAQASQIYHNTVLEVSQCCYNTTLHCWGTCYLEMDPTTGFTTLIWNGGPCSDGGSGAFGADNADGAYFVTTDGSDCNPPPDGSSVYMLNPSKTISVAWTKIIRDPVNLAKPHKILLNQDGDLIVASQTSTNDYGLFKIHYLGTGPASISTLVTASSLGRPAVFDGPIGINIDTGNYLVCDRSTITTPTTVQYPVLEIAQDGTVTTWATGGGFGWDNAYSAPQNHRTGDIEGPQGNLIYQLKAGTSARTTLGKPPILGSIPGAAEFDLQTAPNQRWVAVATSSIDSHAYYIDRKTSAVTTILNRKQPTTAQYIIFKGGRHIQTVMTAAGEWDIYLSCPQFANKNYVLVAGISGVRPGIPLPQPDGRNINLNADPLFFLTLQNLARPCFDPGSLLLDAKGGAQGKIDATSVKLPPGGLPLWIAMAVLDPKAPLGIAYLPDTYVMRLHK